MSKILLIEPERILKQAICLFLFPEHEVEESSSRSTDNKTLKEYDLLIVDGSALRDRNHLTPEFTRTVRHSDTPTLWLEEVDSSLPFKREKLLFVKKPIEREKFKSAIDSLVSPKAPKKAPPGSAGAREGKETMRGRQTELQFIELEDVVSEKPLPRKSGKQAKKSK
ncbi:MAG: hypothetical protein ACE5FB_05695 [Candidatus Binatia bacterium]